ncbi:MAG TPA: hypothetical protein V6D28_06385 [Leptolyngbyaceae cyanobacterium]
MKLTLKNFNKQAAFKLALAGMTAFLSLAPVLQVSAASPPCPTRNSRKIYFGESANYDVSICSAENNPNRPKYYVGSSKNGRGGITLPLSSYRGIVFTARNGRYTYTLNGSRGQLIVQLPNGRRSVERLFTYGPLNHYGH